MADETPEVAATPSHEDNVMAWLDANDPSGEEPDVSPLIGAPHTTFEATMEATEVPDDEPEVETAEETTEDEPTETAVEVSSDEYARAREALREKGWTDAEFSALPEDRILALGLKQARIQEDYNAKSVEFRRLKSEAAERGKVVEGREVSVESSPQPIGPNLEAATAKLREALDLEEGEGSKPLTEWASALTAPLMEKLNVAEATLQAQSGLVVNMAARQARGDLLAEYPGLKEKGGWDDTLAQVRKLNPAAYQTDDIFEGVQSMVRDAAAVVFRGRVATEAVKKQATKDRSRGVATPPGSRKAVDTTPETAFGRFSKLAEQLEKGHGVGD